MTRNLVHQGQEDEEYVSSSSSSGGDDPLAKKEKIEARGGEVSKKIVQKIKMMQMEKKLTLVEKKAQIATEVKPGNVTVTVNELKAKDRRP